MSNALHDYAKLFEKYAANNGGTGAILAGEDCLALANEMRMDADDLERENAKLRELSSIMLKCIMANERKALICWECPMHKQFDELRSYCCLEHEASELGIEVGQ